MSGGLAAQGLTAVSCLAFVVLLILGAARLARALPALRASAPMAGGLALCGSLALDRQRRLHLVEIEGRRLLVLTGGGSDTMLALPLTP